MRPASASSDPRRHAATILARVDAAGAYAARLLADARPLTRELVLGTLRWQLVIDELLRPLLRRRLADLQAEVRATLRMGAFEIHRLDTPQPVAVAEAVRVVRTLMPAASGLVNAVLRRACECRFPDPADGSRPLHLRYSHPEWLVERWRGRLGALLEPALAASQQPAPLCLLGDATEAGELERAGCRLEPHPWVAGVRVVRGGAAAAVAALAAGRAYAMDPTAVLVATMLPATAALTVDLAAAPGGKTLALSLARPGSPRLALDRNLGRVALLRRTAALAAQPPWIAAADGAAAPLRLASCGAVLLDAPCSGTGTLRRHPEIRWRLRPGDLAASACLQKRLVESAARLLAPGGHLLYATCSLEPEENEDVVAGLDLERIDLSPAVPGGIPHILTPVGGVVIPPSATGDGFTAHLFRRGA